MHQPHLSVIGCGVTSGDFPSRSKARRERRSIVLRKDDNHRLARRKPRLSATPDTLGPNFPKLFTAAILQELTFGLMVHFPGFLDQVGATEARIGLLYGSSAALALFLRPPYGRILDAREWNWWVGGVAVVGMAVGVALVVWDLAGNPVSWNLGSALSWLGIAAAVVTTVAVVAFSRRSKVAQRGMEKVHFDEASLADLGNGGRGGTRHVICATEMQSGLHAFFTDSFVYSYSFGVSTQVDKVPLAFAVQASAALPGGFAPRRLNTAPLSLQPAGEAPAPGACRPMVLLDGGVYDNMADQWFMGMRRRRERFPSKLAGQLSEVEDLIVANASTGWSWRPFGWFALRIREIREIKAIGSTQSVMYNTIGRRRRAHLIDYWNLNTELRGAFVEVNDNPAERAQEALQERILEIAPDEGWEALVERSRTYPTVLRRIDHSDAMGIMWHAYLLTGLAVNRFFGIPLAPDQLPFLEEFETGLQLQSKAGDKTSS